MHVQCTWYFLRLTRGYGLWLDRELNRGMSCLCDTFCNDSLCSTGVDGYFLITSVEVYSFL